MKKLIIKSAVVLLAMVLACGVATQVNAKVKVKSVTVKTVTGSKKVVYVAKGKKVKLATNVTVTPNSAKNQKVTYMSSKKSVATVSSKGVIKGIKIGNAKITVRSKKNKKKKVTIKVRVVYPVKKVKISNNNTALCVDESKNLTAKVTGTKKKNFCKIVHWTTSNKKVAVVSAKGIVKAVGVGTATITVKAVDGTGKKASCKVKVAPRKTSIMGISFNTYYNRIYADVMYVRLNQPKALTQKDFSIRTKSSADVQYLRERKIISVITTNNKDYTITFDSSIYIGEYVQVTINALDGAKTREQRFMTDDGFRKMNLKTNVGCYFSYDIDNIARNSTMKIVSGSLPAGLTYDAKNNEILGTPTAVTKNQKCIVSVKDEKGRVVKSEFNFIIGDETHIVAANETLGNLKSQRVLTSDNNYGIVEACGGSGSYTYQMENDCNGKFTVNSSGSVIANSDTQQPGTYYPIIRVIDKANNAIYADATWTIVVTKGAQVSVQFASSSYQFINIYFRNKETGYETTIWSKNVVQKLTVEPGTYDVYYYSKSSDGERKCNYLSKNLAITHDTTLQYKISNFFRVVCHPQDIDGNVYSNDHYYYVVACMFNSSGKCVERDSCYGTVYFEGYEAGNYYICFYDLSKKQLIGKTDVFVFNGNAELTVKLNIKNNQ